MKALKFERIRGLKGRVTPPSDKSVTHRAVILAAMAEGVSNIQNPLISADIQATVNVLRALGVTIALEESCRIKVTSDGYQSFKSSERLPLYCANSGTTARLIMGMLAPRKVFAAIDGDSSLRKRPMDRVISPLSKMGASIRIPENIRLNGMNLPVIINPSNMFPANIVGDVQSAQVKSAVLLAGLQLTGTTSYSETAKTRDHTEKLMPLFGADINVDGLIISVNWGQSLSAANITVPGDISSAAFLIAAALIFEDSEIRLCSVGINPTRRAFLDILISWGADISINNVRAVSGAEPVADITVRSSQLSGGVIEKELSRQAIDELPLLGTLGLFTQNGVEIRNAEELRLKECDRIAAIVSNLTKLGFNAQDLGGSFAVAPYEKEVKKSAELQSFKDHRIAMINVLLAKRFGLNILFSDLESIDASYPGFLRQLSELEVG